MFSCKSNALNKPPIWSGSGKSVGLIHLLGFVRKVGSQATADARHAYHRLKATCQLFIACGDAATFFKPTKAAFYRIPLPIFGFVEPPG
ncbi:hypothetical protein AWR38_22685 [Idiomarina sp. WRN-38]|nr:hypothetical protein AUR68_22650 [Idiomarina sp. H105]OAE93804.1 hypothetical protein AWR38_22685 [Idiomarina sp. WRN-38]